MAISCFQIIFQLLYCYIIDILDNEGRVKSVKLRRGVLDTTFVISVSVACGMSVVFSTNKTDCHDITEILLKVALNTIILILHVTILVHILLKHTLLYSKLNL
jgi:hypothetical protein